MNWTTSCNRIICKSNAAPQWSSCFYTVFRLIGVRKYDTIARLTLVWVSCGVRRAAGISNGEWRETGVVVNSVREVISIGFGGPKISSVSQYLRSGRCSYTCVCVGPIGRPDSQPRPIRITFRSSIFCKSPFRLRSLCPIVCCTRKCHCAFRTTEFGWVNQTGEFSVRYDTVVCHAIRSHRASASKLQHII